VEAGHPGDAAYHHHPIVGLAVVDAFPLAGSLATLLQRHLVGLSIAEAFGGIAKHEKLNTIFASTLGVLQ
jgi:hypothetical protein